jgi:hypothetical protein
MICRTCAYRDTEINHCWYTMTTNKINHTIGTTCCHYVDVNKVKQVSGGTKK